MVPTVKGLQRCTFSLLMVIPSGCVLCVVMLVLFLAIGILHTCLFSLIAKGTGICNASGSENYGTASYDILIFSLHWPFSVCEGLGEEAGLACESPPAKFTIRGLWPTSRQGPSPVCCSGKKQGVEDFSLLEIVDLAPQLLHFWPDLTHKSNGPALWESQWIEYGSCSGLSLRSYFRKAVELCRRYDFERALLAHGVVTATAKTNRYSVLQTAVNSATGGYQVSLRCRKIKKEVLLDTIQVCLNKNLFTTMDCSDYCLSKSDDCCNANERISLPYRRNELGNEEDHSNITEPPSISTASDSVDWKGAIAGIVFILLSGGISALLLRCCLRGRRDISESALESIRYQSIAS